LDAMHSMLSTGALGMPSRYNTCAAGTFSSSFDDAGAVHYM